MTTTPTPASVRRFAPSPRSVTLALAALVSLPAAGSFVAAPSGVTLRYGLKPGHAYQQTASMTLEMALDPSSLPAGLAPLVQSMASGMQQAIEFKGLLEVKDKGGDGATPFGFKVTEAHGSFTSGGKTRDVPSVAAVTGKAPITGRFTADGRRVEIDPAAPAETGGVDRRREQLAQALPELPEKALAVGESFEARVPMRLPSGGGQGDTAIDTRWIYTLRAIDGRRAAFDLRMVLPEPSATSLSKGRSVAIGGGAEGSAEFDLKDGLFTRIALEAALDLTYGVPVPPGVAAPGAAADGAAAPTSTEAGAAAPTPPVLTLKSKLTGPIRITMGRQAAR